MNQEYACSVQLYDGATWIGQTTSEGAADLIRAGAVVRKAKGGRVRELTVVARVRVSHTVRGSASVADRQVEAIAPYDGGGFLPYPQPTVGANVHGLAQKYPGIMAFGRR